MVLPGQIKRYNMKGYKAFDSNLKCRGYQFNTSDTFVHEGDVILCEAGFHFCTELQDVVKYYSSSDMKVYEIEADGIITQSENDCSKRACSQIKLIREISLDELKNSINSSASAYWWARYIGDREYMKQFITKSKLAYTWAIVIGDKEHMKQFVTESKWAYWWAYYIGDKEYMKQFVTESKWSCEWIEYINPDDKQYFIDKGLI